MNTLLKKCLAATLMFGSLLSISAMTPASAAAPTSDLKGKNVVLVHGAFADGSSWDKVIPLLQAKGLHVVAVQNPLSSLDGDVAATRRVIEQQDGPVILVGHSWVGAVITQAGTDDKVTQPAWQTRPSWFVVAQKDRMIPPALQDAMAHQIGATVVKVDASHVAMLSKPTEVAAAIIEAARAAQ